MKFDQSVVKEIQTIQKAHFIGQASHSERVLDSYCLIIQTNEQIFVNMKDGFCEALIKDSHMQDLLMLVGFNNTVYCVQSNMCQSNAEVVEYFIRPDGSWKRK